MAGFCDKLPANMGQWQYGLREPYLILVTCTRLIHPSTLRGVVKWVLVMVTATDREENGEFCTTVDPGSGLLAYWPSRLKVLAVNLSQPSGRRWAVC